MNIKVKQTPIFGNQITSRRFPLKFISELKILLKTLHYISEKDTKHFAYVKIDTYN